MVLQAFNNQVPLSKILNANRSKIGYKSHHLGQYKARVRALWTFI